MAEQKSQPKHQFNQEDDNANIAEWRYFLKSFKDLEASEVKDRQVKLMKLRDDAKVNKVLNYRQVDGIVQRVNNVLNGTYGKTKTDAQLNAGRVK